MYIILFFLSSSKPWNFSTTHCNAMKGCNNALRQLKTNMKINRWRRKIEENWSTSLIIYPCKNTHHPSQVIDEDATCISYLLLWYDFPTTQFSFCVPNLVEWFVLVQQYNDIAALIKWLWWQVKFLVQSKKNFFSIMWDKKPFPFMLELQTHQVCSYGWHTSSSLSIMLAQKIPNR